MSFIFKNYKIRPKKKFGQIFLVDKKVVKKIIETANLEKKDVVLEIGPGIGNLTAELAKEAKKVMAVEKDREMVKILKEKFKNEKNVEIVEGDIRDKMEKILVDFPSGYKVVANIPYYLTSFLIRKFLGAKKKPKEMVLMVQKEVAQRICSKPPKMNLLAVSVQFYAKPEIISFVSKNSFWPKPKVDSALLKISKIRNQIPKRFSNLFFKIVKAGFSQPRKQLVNNLSKMLKLKKEGVRIWLLKNGIKPNQRAENLDVENWIKLSKSLKR